MVTTATTTSTTTTSTVSTLSTTALVGNMEVFDSETSSFETYIGRFEQFLLGNMVPEGRYLTLLITFGGKEIYETLESILYPVVPSESTFKDAKDALMNYFQPKSATMFERFQFYKRDQKESESIADFIKALKQLAKKCNFGEFLEEALRDRFVCGLKSESIQFKLMDHSLEVDFKKACQLALSMEIAKSNVASMHESSSIHKLKFRNQKTERKKTASQVERRSK